MSSSEPSVHPAALPDDALLNACSITRQRRSGPGGQHRNKVETAVVITHEPTGVRGQASERRSQEENRRVALGRLRVNLALHVRQPRTEGSSPSALWVARQHRARIAVSVRHADFPPLLAEALDVLSAAGWKVSVAAEQLGVSASQLVKFLGLEPAALGQLNTARKAAGLKPLAGR